MATSILIPDTAQVESAPVGLADIEAVLQKQEAVYDATAAAIIEQATERAQINNGEYDTLIFYVAPARTGTGLISHLAGLAGPDVYPHMQPVKTQLREGIDIERLQIDLNAQKLTNQDQVGVRTHLIKETIGATDPEEFLHIEEVIERLLAQEYPREKIKLLAGFRDPDAAYRSQQQLWEDQTEERINPKNVNDAYRIVADSLDAAKKLGIATAVVNYDLLREDPQKYLANVLIDQLQMPIKPADLEAALNGWGRGNGYYETTIMYQIPPHEFVSGTAEPNKFDPKRVKVTPTESRDFRLSEAHRIYDELASRPVGQEP